ncbi:hypothetical protein IGI04_038742 [Brassica rapa subsp. trilocularis]|uniref:Uncharacterized protein n=1 Tax=Brassica rapa subsp. trilocularis TaxID=1813537 RepID=A0ABQ7LL37_BRACM|nr:hypothetical protein IGI04_038742 [Brassica rapa subsp. trilocularis]
MAKKMGVTMEVGNDGVAVITISNPPVNSLASPREVQDANHRSDVKAIVLTENGGRFSGGFNINVFQQVHKTGTQAALLSMLRSEAMSLIDRMVEHGFRPDGVTYGTVLNRLCKYGETSMALDFLRKIKHQEAACCCS